MEPIQQLQQSLAYLGEIEGTIRATGMTAEANNAYYAAVNRIRQEAYDAACLDLVSFHDFKMEAGVEQEVANLAYGARMAMHEMADELEKAYKVLFETRDVYLFLCTIQKSPIFARVHYDMYMPYWQKHIVMDNGRYVDTIHGLVWNDEERAWTKGKSVVWSFRLLPPTIALAEAERKELSS